jgi:large subunit ribosomal protein L6
MSRIGNKPIQIPSSVKITVSDAGAVRAEGPKGKLQWELPKGITGTIKDNSLVFARSSDDRKDRALHGLARAMVNNMVIGASQGFVRELEIHGVGFKAALQGKTLKLNLGFSHDILFPVPEGIKITVTENTKLKIEGIDKQLVGQVASDIRSYYPPEPYKGKGVRYVGEHINRKEGKTVQ